MKPLKILFVILMNLLIVTPVVNAGDFDWIRDFNIKAEGNPSEFKARLEARFQVGDLKIKAVLDNVEKPSDAYILFRLGEMSNQPIDHIIKIYKAERGKGWGVLAKSLGIKPGSKDFHALKQGQDLYDGKNKVKGKAMSKAKSKGRK